MVQDVKTYKIKITYNNDPNNSDTEKLLEQQQNSLHSLLGDLQANLIKDYTTSEIKLEYAFLELSDDTYYDIRKERQYSSAQDTHICK